MKKVFLFIVMFILCISFNSVKAAEKTADMLKKNVVTSGDGLYKDTTIDGRYVYRGGNPNNYIILGDEFYRIMSVEKDGTIKVVKQESIGDIAWDEGGARYSTDNNDFCTDKTYGCKSWGSNTTTLDSNGNKVTQMPWDVNGTLRNLPEKEATLNTYLNNDFYNSLSDDIKSLAVEKEWNIGPTSKEQTNLSESIKEESTYKWKGKVALMNATDYVKASTNSACSSLQAYYYKHSGGSESCYNNSSMHNYLFLDNYPWTVSPFAGSDAHDVIYVSNDGSLGNNRVFNTSGVRPAFYLSAKIKLKGNGTTASPYILVNDEKNDDNKSKFVDYILEKVVTTGDGLYADNYTYRKYVYKGRNPNNFIKFNNDLWRIISVDKDKTIKIIKANPLDNPVTSSGENVTFNNSESVNYGTYCSLSTYSRGEKSGCNAWGKSEFYVGGYASGSSTTVTYGTVTEDSLINKYLNNEYFNNLSKSSSCAIVKKDYYFGSVADYGSDNIVDTIKMEKSQVWNGNIALPTVSDVVLASSDVNKCGTIEDINENYYAIVNREKVKDCTINGQVGNHTEECYNSCSETNWLMPSKNYKFTDYNYLLLNSEYNYIGNILAASYQGITGQAVGDLYNSSYNNTFNIRPVTYLRNDLEYISGDGSENNPYIIESEVCGLKNNNSNLIVNVPSTSMFISIFIIGGFVLITIICIVIYLKVFKKKDIKK